MMFMTIKKIIEGSVGIGILVTLCYASSPTWFLLLIVKLASCYYIKHAKNKKEEKLYGHMKYERNHRKSTYWSLLLPLIQLALIVINFNLFLSYDYNVQFVILLLTIEACILYIFKKYNFKIYAQGILYDNEFYSFKQLKALVLVKNYEGEYEYYKSYKKKVLTLTEYEMKYLA